MQSNRYPTENERMISSKGADGSNMCTAGDSTPRDGGEDAGCWILCPVEDALMGSGGGGGGRR